MGNVLIFAATVLPAISGALHRPWWIIPTCAALGVIGFFVADPKTFEGLRNRGQVEFVVTGMITLSTIGCATTFAVGHLLRYVMFRL